jgi:hypothetical protein
LNDDKQNGTGGEVIISNLSILIMSILKFGLFYDNCVCINFSLYVFISILQAAYHDDVNTQLTASGQPLDGEWHHLGRNLVSSPRKNIIELQMRAFICFMFGCVI